MPFDTPLSDADEIKFQAWLTQQKQTGGIHQQDTGQDYDMRGAWKAGLSSDPATRHWPDTYKKPNHPTFSDESIYSSLTGTKPGRWGGPNRDQYIPFGGSPMPTPTPQDPAATIQTGLNMLQHEAGFDPEAHTQRVLSTGPFAEAQARQSVWYGANQAEDAADAMRVKTSGAYMGRSFKNYDAEGNPAY